jgi:1-acyl-sn-glycerol-3-phosphate acyltransferase
LDLKGQSFSSRLVKRAVLALFRWKGWKLNPPSGPVPRRCIILGVPHTSNWDFVFFIGATYQYGISPSFMGKTSLFRWPLRRFMFDMGGIPVDRTAKDKNYVDQVVTAFAERGELALVVAPEGTRTAVKAWRSGFYHIAFGAGVPLVPAWVDNALGRGGIGPPIMPSGDYGLDLAKLLAFYETVMPGHPRLAVLAASVAAAQGERMTK